MNYDITIIGAGIAGLTTACALAQQTHLSIAIIDTQPIVPTWQPANYHHRVSAIALSSKRIFQNIGAWQSIIERRVSAFKAISVWDSASQAKLDFTAAEVSESQLGYIIENNAMQDALLNRLQAFPQVALYPAAVPENLIMQNDGVILQTNESQFKTKLIIAADGANSWVRKQANMPLSTEDYGHDAIVATVRTKLPHEQIARQVFLENGPLAFLPLYDSHLSSIVWSMPPEQAEAVLALSDDEFKLTLAEAFSCRLGEVVEVSKRFSFPLKKQRAEHYISERIALIGDAAHTVHPLAGQGLNIGLLDAAALVDVIADAQKENRDYSKVATLRRYERWRKGENTLMLSGIDVIKMIFCSNSKTNKLLRSFSLHLTERVPLFKKIFTHQAVGLQDGLPTLARQHC